MKYYNFLLLTTNKEREKKKRQIRDKVKIEN